MEIDPIIATVHSILVIPVAVMRRFVICTRYLGDVSPLFSVSLVACLTIASGCGNRVAEQNADSSPQDSSSAGVSTQNGTVSNHAVVAATQKPVPADVVSQFLDRVRRGGKDSDAGQLLTHRAQSELNRIGRSVQPIGSPDAFFNVTRSEPVPGESDSMLVHSIWSEPSGDGTMTEYQVVWAVQLENGDWRISGLAMELQPGQPPTIIDFENGDLMAQLLDEGRESSESSPTPTSQAAANAETISR